VNFLTEAEPPRGETTTVAPGIRRLVAPNPGLMTCHGTNTYLLETGEGLAVVDPGPDDPAHVERILAVAGAPIRAILLTHTHQDHVGALRALREATGATLYAWHAPADPAGAPDTPLHDGDRVGAWQALHTPGHAPDHLCYAGPDGILLSGDHVMGWSTTVVSPPSGDMSAYFSSLERLLGREDRVYLPGHGPPIPDPRGFASALLRHRQGREATIRAALGEQPMPVHALADAVYPGLQSGLRRAAERSITAHLLKLRDEGAAAETASGWVAVPVARP